MLKVIILCSATTKTSYHNKYVQLDFIYICLKGQLWREREREIICSQKNYYASMHMVLSNREEKSAFSNEISLPFPVKQETRSKFYYIFTSFKLIQNEYQNKMMTIDHVHDLHYIIHLLFYFFFFNKKDSSKK